MRFAEPTKNVIPAADASRSAKNSDSCSRTRSAPTSTVASVVAHRITCVSAVQRSR